MSAKDIHWDEEDLSLTHRLGLINYEQLFNETPHAKIINNDMLVSRKLSKSYVEAILNNSDGDIGFVPTCSCGNIKGVSKIGSYCVNCDTECADQFTDTLAHISWLGIPESMPPVLHPIWYNILRSWTSVKRKKISLIDIILNPEEEVPDEYAHLVPGRGFQYFYDNADAILDMFINTNSLTASKRDIGLWMTPFRQLYRDVMFTRKLPILHNSLHPLKSNGATLKYVDRTSKEVLSAVIDLSIETFKQHSAVVNPITFNKTLWDIYQKVIAYYGALESEKLAGKHAIIRKHCGGTRVHHSFRAVIVPHEIIRDIDEVLLPWGIVLELCKETILNHLQHRFHLPAPEAHSKYLNAKIHYDETVAKCIEMFIKESPGKQITLLFGRNPTLLDGSVLQLKFSDFKRDPSDQSIAISACYAELPNFGGLSRYIYVAVHTQECMNCYILEETAA